MQTLASLLFDSEESADSDDVQRKVIATLEVMKETYRSREQKGGVLITDTDDNEYVVFARLLKYKTDAAVDISILVTKLASCFKGSAAGGLMQTLASLLFDSEESADSDDVQLKVKATLKGMKVTYDSRTANGHDIVNDTDEAVYFVFTQLLKFKTDAAVDISILAEKLIKCRKGSILGGKVVGLMWKLASKFFGKVNDGKLMFGSSIEDIVARLEALNTWKNNEEVGALESSGEGGGLTNTHELLVEAFHNLKAQSPDIVEDFDSLAMFLYNHSQSREKTFNRYFKELIAYLTTHDKTNGIVIVKFEKDNRNLYRWWAEQSGLKIGRIERMGADDYNSNRFAIVAKDLGVDSKYYKMLSDIDGFSFDLVELDGAITEREVERHGGTLNPEQRALGGDWDSD